jgi:hypothetical protein
MEKGCNRLSSDLETGISHSLASRLPYHTAKGDRWSDNPDGEVREMRNAETVLEIGQRPLESRGEIERLKPGSEGGGWKRAS